MNFNDRIYGNKNLLKSTHHKIGQSCTWFSKEWVYQRLVQIPNATYPLVPLSRQVWSWSQTRLVRAVGGSGACRRTS